MFLIWFCLLGLVGAFYILLSLFSLPFNILCSTMLLLVFFCLWEYFGEGFLCWFWLSSYVLVWFCFGTILRYYCALYEIASYLLFLWSIYAVVSWRLPFCLLWWWWESDHFPWVHIPCSIQVLGLSLSWQLLGLLSICCSWMLCSRLLLFLLMHLSYFQLQSLPCFFHPGDCCIELKLSS